MKTHHLKVWPWFYRELLTGAKTFELRKNDRDFKVGDTLEEEEWNDATQQYTESPHLRFTVTHIMHGPLFGLEAGWCCMSIKPE